MEKFLEDRIVMKVMEVSPFCFRFKSANNKKKSYQLLVNFLRDKQWLNERSDKMSPLCDFHTDEKGDCHMLLANDIISDDFVELTNEMFEDLVSEPDVEWIKVEFHPAT